MRFTIAAVMLSALVALAMSGSSSVSVDAESAPKRLLVVTVTKGFRHDSIPTVEKLVGDLATESGKFTVDYARTDDELRAKTTAEGLKNYDGVFFGQTTGDIPLADRDAFVAWVEAGHALIGIHSASDTFHGYAPYLMLLGGEFEKHGEQATVTVQVKDPKHPSAKGLAPSFETHDEIYLFKDNFRKDAVHVVLALDKHPNTGAPGFFPLAWTNEPGKGRVFYTALGHREDVLTAPWYHDHLLNGILWALRA